MHSPVVLIFDGPESAWNQWQILQKTCNTQDVPGALCRNIFVFHARAHKFSLGPYLVFEFVTLYLKTNFCSPPFFFCSVSLMFLFFSLLCLKRGLEMNYFLRASVYYFNWPARSWKVLTKTSGSRWHGTYPRLSILSRRLFKLRF